MAVATFEAATLSDAITAAGSYVPTKGSGAERAAGIVLNVEHDHAVLRSTDLDVFWHQRIPVVHAEPVTWRLPVQVATAVLGNLPMGLGSTATLTDNPDGFLYMTTTGTSRARLKLLSPELAFPQWEAAPIDELEPVAGLNERIGQVRWAVASEKVGGVLQGLRLSGTHLYATDGNNLARVPLTCPVKEPVTAPLHLVSKAIASYPELYIGCSENKFIVSTETDIQMQVYLLRGNYPPCDSLLEMPLAHRVIFDREQMLKALARIQAIVDDKHYPMATAEFMESGELRLTMDVPDVGSIIEEVVADSLVEPFTFGFRPNILASMVKSCRSTLVTLHYEATGKPVKVEDGLGFVAITMPRRQP